MTPVLDTKKPGSSLSSLSSHVRLLHNLRGESYTVISEPISTIYETGNQSSHFHKLWDSLRIYRKLLAAAFRSL